LANVEVDTVDGLHHAGSRVKPGPEIFNAQQRHDHAPLNRGPSSGPVSIRNSVEMIQRRAGEPVVFGPFRAGARAIPPARPASKVGAMGCSPTNGARTRGHSIIARSSIRHSAFVRPMAK